MREGRTPAITGPDRRPLRGSVAEIAYMRLGGLKQWTMLRGRSVENPPLVLLHGGPGLSETAFFRRYNEPLEEAFTLVFWDQRGAGRSRHGAPRESMTVERFVLDLDELVDAVRDRLGQDRVAIFGHSWGTVLGILYAARFPEKVSAYVGSGQIGDWAAGERASYAWAVAEAERTGATRILGKLKKIGPPPHDPDALFTQRTCLSRLEGNMSPRALWKLARTVLGGRESSALEMPAAMRAFRRSIDAMWEEVSILDLNALAPELQVPVFFFLGRRDRWVPPQLSVAYFERLAAPSKELVWFERSGHEPFVDEPGLFNAEMERLVRPAL